MSPILCIHHPAVNLLHTDKNIGESQGDSPIIGILLTIEDRFPKLDTEEYA